jgi:lysozyme family protein
MNISDFKRAMEFTLRWEGGYSNDPDDPGGETKYGISKKSYPQCDIKNLSEQEAIQIYISDYWLASGCEDVTYPMNLVVFDSAVNCGSGTAKGWLRKSATTQDMINLRRDYYLGLVKKKPALKKFLKGWLNRIADLEKLVTVSSLG